MKDPTPQPLRGEAAWRAAKEAIAKRNDEAWAGGAARRAAQEEKVAKERHAAERLDLLKLPKQPRH
jgi:hypothetical protein